MSSPEWKMAVAADGVTEVRVARAKDGTTTIRLSSGAVSMLAAIDGASASFLLSQPEAAEHAR